ncbi:hypothetical protein MTO96_036469 [Rhipicephalus appendiculatus]
MLYTESPVCVTPWTYMNWRNSQPTLKDVGTVILSKAAIPDTVTVMISFTMGAHVFKSDTVYHYALNQFRPWAFGWLPYEQICLHDMPYDDFDDSSVVHVLSLESTFSYCAETSETIISKVKKWLAVVAPKRHGFAFYDMEMGDVNNACSKGAFYRIAQLKQYLRT